MLYMETNNESQAILVENKIIHKIPVGHDGNEEQILAAIRKFRNNIRTATEDTWT